MMPNLGTALTDCMYQLIVWIFYVSFFSNN